jgi:hypothetical protein
MLNVHRWGAAYMRTSAIETRRNGLSFVTREVASIFREA